MVYGEASGAWGEVWGGMKRWFKGPVALTFSTPHNSHLTELPSWRLWLQPGVLGTLILFANPIDDFSNFPWTSRPSPTKLLFLAEDSFPKIV